MFNSRVDGWVADYYDITKKMSTYLLAVVICEFDYREMTTSNGKIQVCVLFSSSLSHRLASTYIGCRRTGFYTELIARFDLLLSAKLYYKYYGFLAGPLDRRLSANDPANTLR